MFRETLLESSSLVRRRSPWPMATAFTLELMAASILLVILPLLSTGIISMATRVNLPAPPILTSLETKPPADAGIRKSSVAPRMNVVPVVNHTPVLPDPYSRPRADTPGSSPNPQLDAVRSTGDLPDLAIRNVIPPSATKRIIISHPSEAMLLTRVVPQYPLIAKISGVQGDVKLHAIIATDGTIQSLTVMSGHPALIPAALTAVEQWKYRPYMLNGQPIEVETFITVTFKRTN